MQLPAPDVHPPDHTIQGIADEIGATRDGDTHLGYRVASIIGHKIFEVLDSNGNLGPKLQRGPLQGAVDWLRHSNMGASGQLRR